MTLDIEKALNILKGMSDEEFDAFFQTLPERTKMLLRAGFASWQEVCPGFYIKINGTKITARRGINT